VQALAQRAGGRRLAAIDGRQEPLERLRVSLTGGVQRRQHPGKRRGHDAFGHQRVQQRRPVSSRADDRGDVLRRVKPAPLLSAGRAKHASGGLHGGEIAGIRALLWHHGVEHEPSHVPGMGQRIAFGDERPVRDAVECQPRHAEREAQGFEVADRLGGRVIAPGAPDRLRARRDRARRRHDQVRGAGRRLQRGATQGARAGSPLIEHHEPVAAKLGAQRRLDSVKERDAGLARAAGQEHEHAVRVAGIAREPDRQMQGSRTLAAVVERDRQRCAGEAVDAGASVKVGQLR
jgi:hypothetical protein